MAIRASPETEARFPSHLSPIIQCKQKVLGRSRIEFYAALIAGIVVAILPMSGLTRSLVLLPVLAMLIDISWRSSYSHAWKRYSKIVVTVLLVGAYSLVVAALVTSEHRSAVSAFRAYINSGHAERFFRWLYLFVGFIGSYLSFRALSLVRGYAASRRAEKSATRQRFRESQKGWLDYRLESEESSKHLHSLVARARKETRRFGLTMKLTQRLINHEKKKNSEHTVVASVAAYWLTVALEKLSTKLEPDLKEMEEMANLFMESTEGNLKAFKIITKEDYTQLAGLHEYFQSQLTDIREIANLLNQFPPMFEKVRGVRQDLTAAINRQATVWRAQIAIFRRIEGHCARMVKLTQTYFDRAILSASEELLSKLIDIVKLMGGDEGMKEYRRLIKERGFELPGRFAKQLGEQS